MITVFSTTGWLCTVAINGWLLFRVTPRMPVARLLKRIAIVFVGAIVCVVAITLLMVAVGMHPSDAFGKRLFSLFFATEVLALLSFVNLIFHGEVDVVGAFHRRVNAVNLDRFPISFLIRHERGLKTFGTVAWFIGGALMLYGVWMDPDGRAGSMPGPAPDAQTVWNDPLPGTDNAVEEARERKRQVEIKKDREIARLRHHAPQP